MMVSRGNVHDSGFGPSQAFVAALAWPASVAIGLGLSVVWLDPRGPVVAFLLNTFFVFEVAGFSSVFNISLPDSYFRPHRFERTWLYEWVGIRLFKRAMCSRLYRRINPDFRLIGGRRGLAALRDGMNSAEAAHGLMFVLVSAVALVSVAMRWFDAAAWLMFFNIFFNAYPVMLQRYNRLRIGGMSHV